MADLVRIPAPLRERLGHDATLGLVETFEIEKRKWGEDVLSLAAERYERRLTEQVSSLRIEMHQSLATLRVELLTWSFLFWVGQVAAMAGLLAFMLRGGR